MKRGKKMDRSKMIKDGMIYLGIFYLLLFIALFLPVIGLLALFLLPVPFVIFTRKYDFKNGMLLGLFTFLLMFFMTPLALPIILSFVAGGIVIGELYRRKKGAFAVLLGGSLAFVGALVLNFIGSNILLGENPVTIVQTSMRESVELSVQMLDMLGQQGAATSEVLHTFIDQIGYIAPAIMIMLGVAYAFIVQVISAYVLRKQKEDITSFPPFRKWTFPKAFIWYYFFTYLLIFIGFEEGSALYTITVNLLPILQAVMIIQGFAFIFFYMYQKNKSKAISVALVIISFILPYALQFINILGIIDLGFDLRKRMESQK